MQQRAQALESEIQHRQELEQRLREALAKREQALAREQAARAEAEAANRAKNEFLAVMSHELRTPKHGEPAQNFRGEHGPSQSFT